MAEEPKPSVRPRDEVLREIKILIDQGLGRDGIVAELRKKFLSQKTNEPYTKNAVSGMIDRNREKYGFYFTGVASATKPGAPKRVYQRWNDLPKRAKTVKNKVREKKSVQQGEKTERTQPALKKTVREDLSEETLPRTSITRKGGSTQKNIEPTTGKETSVMVPSTPQHALQETETEVIKTKPRRNQEVSLSSHTEKRLAEYHQLVEKRKQSPFTIDEIMKDEARFEELWELLPPSHRPSQRVPVLCQCAIRKDGQDIGFCGNLGSAGVRGMKRCDKHRGMTAADADGTNISKGSPRSRGPRRSGKAKVAAVFYKGRN